MLLFFFLFFVEKTNKQMNSKFFSKYHSTTFQMNKRKKITMITKIHEPYNRYIFYEFHHVDLNHHILVN